MTVIEKEVIGKQNFETCEDAIVVNKDFAAVVDGSTSKTAMRINPIMSNGRYCMQLVCKVINDMPFNTNVYQFCDIVTQYIKSIYIKSGINLDHLKSNPECRLTANAVIYSSFYREIWFIGDCQCYIDNVLYNFSKPTERILAEKRAEYLNYAIEQKITSTDEVMNGIDIGREQIIPMLIENCKGQNITFPVIDGFPIPKHLIHIVKLPQNASQIILASDGYPKLFPTLRESEEALSQLLKTDPLCIKEYKATKGLKRGYLSFDDRCYLRLKL